MPHILEALPPAIEGGLRLPLVYNSGGYDSLESNRFLHGVVDIYARLQAVAPSALRPIPPRSIKADPRARRRAGLWGLLLGGY